MIELAIVFVLVVLNGVFSLSELAVISARRSRLRGMAEAGQPGASAALALAEDPGRFLSTVQIGITLVGVLAGAFSGSTLGERLAVWLADQGIPHAVAEPLGFSSVVALVTYLSIVIGELVPKRLALRNPEGLACRVAWSMKIASQAAAPVAWLLDASGNLIFRLLGLGRQPEDKVTDEDLRSLIAEAERHGTIETAERHMIAGVMRLGDRSVRGVMTPRPDVDWINVQATDDEIREAALRSPHSRLPVGDGSPDAMLGVVASRDVLAALVRGETLDLRGKIRAVPMVPDTADALDVLHTLRQARVAMALVHDEYGHFEGLVTPADLGEVIIGAFHADDEADEERAAVRREDGSWLLSGWMPVDEMAELLKLPLPARRDYQTVAGFMLHAMRRVPQVGEAMEDQGWCFEVVDLDALRIDKILAAPVRHEGNVAARRSGVGPNPRWIGEDRSHRQGAKE
ncbi:MAG: hemolysin family protein [Rhodopila sp.]